MDTPRPRMSFELLPSRYEGHIVVDMSKPWEKTSDDQLFYVKNNHVYSPTGHVHSDARDFFLKHHVLGMAQAQPIPLPKAMCYHCNTALKHTTMRSRTDCHMFCPTCGFTTPGFDTEGKAEAAALELIANMAEDF